MPLPALRDPLSRPLAISFLSRSFFVNPPSPVCSRPFFFYFPSGYSVFLYTVFLLGPVVAPCLYIHIRDFNINVPFFSINRFIVLFILELG